MTDSDLSQVGASCHAMIIGSDSETEESESESDRDSDGAGSGPSPGPGSGPEATAAHGTSDHHGIGLAPGPAAPTVQHRTAGGSTRTRDCRVHGPGIGPVLAGVHGAARRSASH